MNKYLVTYAIEGEPLSPKIETSAEIFRKMEMDDCYDIRIVNILWLKKYNAVSEFEKATDVYPVCRFYGTWHDSKDPLRMEIRLLSGTREVLSVGYATEH